jgi:hypothetical protein
MTDKFDEPQEGLTHEEAIQIIVDNAEKSDASSGAVTGACVYRTISGASCAQVSKFHCRVLKGIWHQGKKCPRR